MHRKQPQIPILSEINPIHIIYSYLSRISFSIVFRLTRSHSSGFFSSSIATKVCKRLSSTPCLLHAPLISYYLIFFLVLAPENFILNSYSAIDNLSLNLQCFVAGKLFDLIPAICIELTIYFLNFLTSALVKLYRI